MLSFNTLERIIIKKLFKSKYGRVKLACYSSYFSMSSIFCVPSMLFVTFHETFGISYTLLGTLVLINFFTQLSIDLIFSFFARFFNIKKTVSTMPLLTTVGLLIYASAPLLFPDNVYAGLVLGTILFSVSGGLSEVLLSPIVASIPSETPERDMSLLHSLYAWGVVSMVIFSSVFLSIFGTLHWQYLILVLSFFPLVSAYLFFSSEIPSVAMSSAEKNAEGSKRRVGLALCVGCIFFGASAENTMTNWISGFLETGLGVSKAYCDIVGIALFAALLGLARLLYAKFGKNITRVLIFSFAGSVVCYLVSGLSMNPVIAALAGVMTGFFTSMLWPGTLIMMEDYMPAMGVTAYAIVASGGDCGSSFAPQLMGIITDAVSSSGFAASLSSSLGISTEQVGLRTGMIISAVYPLIGLILMFFIKRYFRKHA